MIKNKTDEQWMQLALRLARRELGNVAPNPAVGCVLIDQNQHIVGRGWTQPGGRPHAERVALDQAGAKAKGAIAYVSLEPCSHTGQTPPCAEGLIEAGVSQVVVGTTDPDPRVAGKGLKMLEEVGISIKTNVLKKESDDLNAGFFSRITRNRPLVTLKVATTLDGKIALGNGESQWITGADARARGHMLRAENDAIMVGIGTVRADDPMLDCRIAGLEHRSPLRVVIDSNLEISIASKLVQSAKQIPVWVLTTSDDEARSKSLEDHSVKVIKVANDENGRVDMEKSLNVLAQHGVTRLLLEGGSTLNASLIRASLLDRLVTFTAPGIIGSDGLSAIGSLGLENLEKMPRFEPTLTLPVGQDMWNEFRVIY